VLVSDCHDYSVEKADIDISHPSHKRPSSSASPFKKKPKILTTEPVINNPLMNLFIGKKIFITTELTNYHEVRRYIIALVM